MKRLVLAAFNLLLGVIVSFSLLTAPVQAGPCTGSGASFLTVFPTWYEYLDVSAPPECEVQSFEFPDDVWKVILALVAILLRIAGLVAVVYTIYGGFKFVLSKGNPSEAAKARQTIIDALIGVAIASVATVLVAFLGRTLTQ